LPKPPVPYLDHTLSRYLEYARVVAHNNKDAIKRTEEAVSQFRKTGIDLQLKLQKFADGNDNWINNFWLPEMYLKVRLALPVNSNPAYIFPEQKFANINEQLKKLIDREMSTGKIKVPMCMEQYNRILSCYREPHKIEDIQHYKRSDKNTRSQWNEHILVMSNNQTFILFTRVGGILLPQTEIIYQLSEIVRMSDGRAQDVVLPIAGGSVGNRDDAAAFWELMKEVPENLQSLDLVRKSLFVVCIDRPRNLIKFRNDLESKMAIKGLHMLHGFGKENWGLNRWYDATIQIIISSDGTNGLCIEHSVAEGIVIINMGEFSINYAMKNMRRKIIAEPKAKIHPKPLTWLVSPQAKNIMWKQIAEFQRLSEDLELSVLIFTDFGKEFIKSCLISPDGFVQLSMQLAYYKVHQHLVSTYESASIRRFRLGRVDNIRAATPEALQWVQAMVDKDKPVVKLLISLFPVIYITNITGHGIDNHLCALKLLAIEEMKQGRLEKLPSIFQDSVWDETMRFPLSTSQVTTTTTAPDVYLCYGPVVKDGYGCSYNLQSNKIIFAPSAFRSCSKTKIDSFKAALTESLRDMRAII
uniref:Choline O-acetyltransferase n=1 Tax=Dracunculus medinensis TaxID=318479 RepID=A0A158Q3N7_DRAME